MAGCLFNWERMHECKISINTWTGTAGTGAAEPSEGIAAQRGKFCCTGRSTTISNNSQGALASAATRQTFAGAS
jgi:hypothetical protein